jgi:hypothetical protein
MSVAIFIPGPLTISDVKQCRHWAAASQPYATGDQLLHYLYAGWEMDEVVRCETHWLGAGRHIVIYHFTLSRDGHQVTMPVIGTPFVDQVVRGPEFPLELVEFESGDTLETPSRQPVAVRRLRFGTVDSTLPTESAPGS